MRERCSWGRCIAMAWVIGMMGAIGGCADEDTGTDTGNTGTEPIEPTLSSLWEANFNTCGPNCHQPAGSVPGGPDLSTQQQFHANLVGRRPSEFPDWLRTGNCDVPLIDPGDPDNSLVVASLLQARQDALAARENCVTTYTIHVTNRVNLDGQTELVDAMRTWIERGAPNN